MMMLNKPIRILHLMNSEGQNWWVKDMMLALDQIASAQPFLMSMAGKVQLRAKA